MSPCTHQSVYNNRRRSSPTDVAIQYQFRSQCNSVPAAILPCIESPELLNLTNLLTPVIDRCEDVCVDTQHDAPSIIFTHTTDLGAWADRRMAPFYGFAAFLMQAIGAHHPVSNPDMQSTKVIVSITVK